MVTAVKAQDDVRRYVRRLNDLYQDVRAWALEFEPDVTFEESRVRLNEEIPGKYSAPALKVKRPGKMDITFVPRGAYMIGGRGRVDASSPLGTGNLVWVEQGGPALAFRDSGEGKFEEVSGKALHPGIAEGWAWTDIARRRLVHLDREVFLKRIFNR